MDKRGQFFLVAAIIIVGLIFSTRAVYNVAVSNSEESTIFDLSEELKFETYQVIDNGVYTNSQNEIISRAEILTDYFSDSNPDNDLLALVGNETDLSVIGSFSKPLGRSSIDLGSSEIENEVRSAKKFERSLSVSTRDNYAVKIGLDSTILIKLDELEKKVSVEIGESKVDFDIRPGQNFYLILRKQNQDETIITK